MMFLKLFLIVFVLLSLGFLGIAIKILIKSKGKFGGTCASQNPATNPDGSSCSFCGKVPEELHSCERTKLKNFVNKFKIGKVDLD